MQKLFNRILIPIDLSPGSILIVEKAVAIARQYNCSVHLLHVVTIAPLSIIAMTESHMIEPYLCADTIHELEDELANISTHIAQLPGDPVKVKYNVVTGTWDAAIIDIVEQYKIDLVLFGQKEHFFKKRKMFLNPDTIAERTKIAVISLPVNRRLIRLYSIVIPVTDFIPVKKLIYGIYMAFNFDCTIKLLGIKTTKADGRVHRYLARSRQIIHENCNIHVETETIFSRNIALAVNQFAIQHSADLIIINPGIQTRMPGFFASLLGNIIQKYALPPVLTVSAI